MGGVGGECVCKRKTWFSGNHHPPAVNPRIALRCCCGFPHPCQLHLLKSTHLLLVPPGDIIALASGSSRKRRLPLLLPTQLSGSKPQ